MLVAPMLRPEDAALSAPGRYDSLRVTAGQMHEHHRKSSTNRPSDGE